MDAELVADGWHVLRLWDFEVARDPARSVQRVAALLDTAQGVAEEARKAVVRRR